MTSMKTRRKTVTAVGGGGGHGHAGFARENQPNGKRQVKCKRIENR